MLIDATFNVLTAHIIGAAIEVHRTLGPGLLESTYMPCLRFELTARQLRLVAHVARLIDGVKRLIKSPASEP